MKYFILPLMILVFIACGSSQKDEDNTKEKHYIVTTSEKFSADTINSTISWVRDVVNKNVNKEIKIFGSTANVTMQNVAFSSNGTMPLLSGEMNIINDTIKNINLTVNFSMIRLYSKNSNKAISTEVFPPSLLKIENISPDTIANHYLLEGELTIKDKTGPISFPASIIADSSGNYTMNGTCCLQTLDWPIRENADISNISKDIISLMINIMFTDPIIKRDSLAID